MILETWFPTVIGFVDNPYHKEIEEKLSNHCHNLKNLIPSGGKEWIANDTYNTSDGVYNLFEDKEFEVLSSWITEQVSDYAKNLKIKGNINPIGAWFNVYKRNDFQEYHTHSDAIISSIYFLKAGPESAKVCFRSPKDKMLHIVYDEHTDYNFGKVKYNPEPGRLIIFTSDTEHSVERHNTDEDRITLSYNYRQGI